MQSPEIKLPYGLRDGLVMHVSEVEGGLACNCVCPVCESPLVARKGLKVTHHFAHHRDAVCEYALETALHLAAKDAICKAGRFVLPDLNLGFSSYKAAWLLASARPVVPDRVALEERLGSIVPDIVLEVNGRTLLVEIAVTHAVDDAKLQKIRDLGVSAIEIDIGHLRNDYSPDAVMDVVVNGTVHKKWLHNVQAEQIRLALEAVATKLPIVNRGLAVHVDHCPLPARVWRGKPYANVIDDCLSCEYALNVDLEGGSVSCLGISRISTFADWRAVTGKA